MKRRCVITLKCSTLRAVACAKGKPTLRGEWVSEFAPREVWECIFALTAYPGSHCVVYLPSSLLHE